MMESEDLVWQARKEKDKLLKSYILEEVKKLVYIAIGSDNVKCIEDYEKPKDFRFSGYYWDYMINADTELNWYLKVLERVGNTNSTRYPIC